MGSRRRVLRPGAALAGLGTNPAGARIACTIWLGELPCWRRRAVMRREYGVEVTMGPMDVSLVALVCIFGGAIVGRYLGSILPEPHLSEDSKDSVKLGMGLVATMCALVLGLLIASAKTYYDTQNAELTDMAAKFVFLDRALAHYGPETAECRAELRKIVERLMARLEERGNAPMRPLDTVAIGDEGLFERTQALTPKDDRQRLIQSQAVAAEIVLGQTRWLMYAQSATEVPKPLVTVLIFWLTVIFISWGIYAPRNGTVAATWFVTAVSVSSAIFLILEMYTPYSGIVLVSSGPLRSALAHLGQ
jgi:hypothetical protein